MRYYGVVYGVGLRFTPEQLSVDPHDQALVDHDMRVIADQLHANAVHSEGEDIPRYLLIARLHLQLCATDIDYQILRVKQKFGTLRYQMRPQTNDVHICQTLSALLDQAETISAHVWESCGEPGRMSVSDTRERDWYQPLCRACRAASGARILAAPVGAPRESRPQADARDGRPRRATRSD